jgi:hypothetical protein
MMGRREGGQSQFLYWLTDDEIAAVFRQSGKVDFLNAIAERRPGIQQWLHRSYVQLAYGYRTAIDRGI